MDWPRLCERVLKLALPNIYCWLSVEESLHPAFHDTFQHSSTTVRVVSSIVDLLDANSATFWEERNKNIHLFNRHSDSMLLRRSDSNAAHTALQILASGHACSDSNAARTALQILALGHTCREFYKVGTGWQIKAVPVLSLDGAQ
eukprot:527791-Pelagomonas_calceolata.AAC.13